MKKLELKNLKVKKLSDQEQSVVTGGLLSIGYDCSARNMCDRMHSRTWGVCCPGGHDLVGIGSEGGSEDPVIGLTPNP